MSIKNILNIASRKPGPYKILSSPTHERYQSNLDLVDAEFYLYRSQHIKGWNNQFAELPKNHFILPEDYIPWGIDFDLVLSQNKFGQYQKLAKIAELFRIPLITIEHTLPLKEWPKDHIKRMTEMKGNLDIFISNFSAKEWQADKYHVIRHCVNTDLFKITNEKREDHILTVVNDYINRDSVLDFQRYTRVTKGFKIFPVGDTPGLSKAANSTQELVKFYNQSKIFLNTSTWSPVPTSLLEAMACLPPGEFVFFDYQCEKIEDIINLKTFDEKTKNDKILKKHKIHYNGSIFKIKASNIPEFRLTENHPVATVKITEKYNKELKKENKRPYEKQISEIEYKECKNLNKNDFLVIPKPKFNQNELPIEDDWLKFYGLFLAEGYTNKGNICLTFHSEEKDLIEFVCFFSKKYLERNTKVEKLNNEKSVRCIFTHTPFARKINEYLNGLSHEKRIHNNFMNMNERQTKIFIEAYLEGDGYRKLNKEDFTYSTTSPYLARQIFYLLMKYNVLPSMSNIKPKNGKIRDREFKGKPGYQISYYSNKKNSKKSYYQDENNFYVKIKDIQETHYVGDVYNLSTESNTFTNPFVLTHNCGCCVVSTNNCAIPEYIDHGINGFLANNDEEFIYYFNLILKDQELANFIGEQARKTILDKCSKSIFTNSWNMVFNKVYESQIFRR